MTKVTFSDITFNKQGEPLYQNKKIGKWWGKTFYRIHENSKTIEYKNLTPIGRLLHHFFGYVKEYHRVDLKTKLQDKTFSLTPNLSSSKKTNAESSSISRPTTPQKLTTDAPASSTPLLTANEKLNATLAKLREFKKEGYKLGVFIGRGSLQSLPKEKENWKWCSLDITDEREAGIDEDRLHLQVNFNDQSLMGQMKGLFTTVGVDFSVMKFMESENPLYDVLIPLLDEDEKEVTLIAENSISCSTISELPSSYDPITGGSNISRTDYQKYEEDKKTAFYKYVETVDKQVMEERLQAYIKASGYAETQWKGLTMETIKMGPIDPNLEGSFLERVFKEENINVPHPLTQLVEEGREFLKEMLSAIFEKVEIKQMPHPLIEDPNEIEHATTTYLYAKGRKT